MAWMIPSLSQQAPAWGLISDEMALMERAHHDGAIKGSEVHNIGAVDV